LLSGQTVMVQAQLAAARVRLYDETGNFLGIGTSEPSGAVRPHRLLAPARQP